MQRVCIIVAALGLAISSWADVTVLSSTGRSVFRRGETFDVHVQVTQLPAKASEPASGTVELWLEQGDRRTRLGIDKVADLHDTFDASYRVDTTQLAAGKGALLVRVRLGEALQQGSLPIEIVTNVRPSDFVIHHISFPPWMLPTGNWAADMRAYGFNFSLHNSGDFHNRRPDVKLETRDERLQEMVRFNIDFLQYPTVFGWGLAHRPIGAGVSWCDPAAEEASAQLVQYHSQAVRDWPNCIGLNPMDEPDVGGYDEFLGKAFNAKTGMEPPAPDTKPEQLYQQDPQRFAAFELFRNNVLQDFNQKMKPYMQEILPNRHYTLQTFGDVLTHAGLYPGTNTFQTLQTTHIYDHWPTSNNWMLFDVNFRRANRKAFWDMPLYVVTGCYGIMEDQWRAAWALGMSEKLDGHGYFTGAGELSENSPWAEYSLAEMVRLNRLNEKYGNFFLSLRKRVEPLAVWYSLDNAARTHPQWDYPQEVVAAYFAVRRAHFPANVVVDEDLRAGLLGEHKVLLAAGVRDDISPDLKKALETFARAGGKVVLDRSSTLQLPGAIRMDCDFREFAAAWQAAGNAWGVDGPVSLQLRRDLFAEDGNLRNLDKVSQTLSPLVSRPIRASNPYTFVNVQEHGRAQYVFVVNDASVFRHQNEKDRWITMQESVPTRVRVTLPRGERQVVYDLFSGQRLHNDADGITLDMPMGGLAVLCVFPAEPVEPALKLVGKSAWPGMITLTVGSAERASSRNPPTGVVPGYLELKDPKGRIAFRKYVSAPLGRADEKTGTWNYALGANDLPGTWLASFTNLLTGKTTTANLEIKPPRDGGATVVTRLPQGMVFDEAAIAGLLKRQGLVVVAGSDAASQSAAKIIADALGLKVVSSADVRKEDQIPEQLQTKPGKWMMARPMPLKLTVGSDVVLVGTPKDNELIKDLSTSGMLRRQLDPRIIGAGHGLVQYVWSPFDLDKDAALVVGFDEAGLALAARQFVAAAQGGAIAREQALVADLSAEKVNPATQPVDAAGNPKPAPPAVVLAKLKLADGTRKMASAGGVIAAGGNDCRLSVFDADGKLLWKQDYSYRVLGVAVSPNGKFIAASAFPRTYVYDREGRLQFMVVHQIPSRFDVEALVVTEGDTRLVIGDWQGRVAAYDGVGKRLWMAGEPPVDKAAPTPTTAPASGPSDQPLAGAVRAGCVVGDRFAMLACRGGDPKKDAGPLVLLSAGGEEVSRRPLDRAHVLVPSGNNLLAASWKKKVYLLDRELKSLWETAMPGFVMSAASSADGETIVAALFDGRVVVLDNAGNIVRTWQLSEGLIPTAVVVDDKGAAAWLGTWQGEMLKVKLK